MTSDRREVRGELANVAVEARAPAGARRGEGDTKVRSREREETYPRDSKVDRCRCNEGFRSSDFRPANP